MEELANMGDKSSLPVIEQIVNTSKDPVELEMARKAIEKLRGSE
jgi:NADPH-dependent ferric siderophore reductase